MKIRCTARQISEIKQDSVRFRIRKGRNLEDTDYNLEIGRDYEVQAIENSELGFRFFIHCIAESDHPYPYPAEFFEIIDTSIPLGWAIKFIRNDKGIVLELLTFSEWANDDSFLERLLDEDKNAVDIYRAHRRIDAGD